MTSDNLKTCSNCKLIKPALEFHKRHTTKDGLSPHCKECQSQRKKEYYKKNKEKVCKSRKKYVENNKPKVIEGQRRYYRNASQYLSDGYVARTISRIAGLKIPKEIIQIKRIYILIQREIKK